MIKTKFLENVHNDNCKIWLVHVI